MNYTKHMKKNVYAPSVLVLAILSFFVYSWLYLFSVDIGKKYIFQSPDETAAYVFLEHFSQKGNFTPIPREILPDFVHPRSTQNIDGHLVPGGFLGQLIIYGIFLRFLHINPLVFTAFFTSLAGIALYGFFSNIGLSKTKSLLATALFLFHPAVIYYSARGLLPNMFFIDLMIFSVYLMTLFLKSGRNTFAVLSTFLIGLGLSVRPMEIGWIMFMLVSFLFLKRHKISMTLLVFMLIYLFLAFIPLAYYNFHTYGSILHTGYAKSDANLLPLAFDAAKNGTFIKYLKIFIAPFGIKPIIIFWNVWRYLILFFAPFSILALIGSFSFGKKKKWYIFSLCFICVWLVLFYGSWQLADNISGNVDIGVSYIRYWLPIYILLIPLILEGLALFSKKIQSIMVVSLIGYLIAFAFMHGPEALALTNNNRQLYSRIFHEVSQQIPDNAIIVSERSDKIFFPEYHVIDVSDQNEAKLIWPRLREIDDVERVYYFSIYPPISIKALNDMFLHPQNLVWRFVHKIEDQYYLYRLKKL